VIGVIDVVLQEKKLFPELGDTIFFRLIIFNDGGHAHQNVRVALDLDPLSLYGPYDVGRLAPIH
jgi:uncharacterized repeat protein (TIGR01451 family)